MSSKKTKGTDQQKTRIQMEKQIEKQKAIAQQHKNKMRPFVRFLKKTELRFNHARVGESRIQYFRIDQFQKVLTKHQKQIQSKEELSTVAKFIKQQLIFFKRPSHLKVKYPNQLQPVLPEDTQKKYASFRFDTTQSKKWMMFGIIFTVLSLVLFPIWPYQLKYGIWLLSLILLIILVSLIVIRLIIYIICAIFGYNVWIFPNLMGEYGIVQSFKPLIYYQKWQNDLFNILIRVFICSSLVAYGCYLYLNPNVFYENIEITKQTVEDIHDWGVGKIKNQKNFSQRAITNLQVILNETADVDESHNSEYTSFNQSIQTQQ